MKNSQFFNYLLYAKSKETSNKKISFYETLDVGKMNGTAITNRLQNAFKIKDNNVYGSSYY